ncbi:hypothetical protein NJ76_26125 [Rhodococcus sp. IITR03]|nr:hypothetical protein NJ76_26125 [Rhodococcus sp. IITR03]
MVPDIAGQVAHGEHLAAIGGGRTVSELRRAHAFPASKFVGGVIDFGQDAFAVASDRGLVGLDVLLPGLPVGTQKERL